MRASRSGGKDGALPANAAQQNGSCIGHGLFPFLGRGYDALERAILLALAAADAHTAVDDRMPVLCLGDGRASERGAHAARRARIRNNICRLANAIDEHAGAAEHDNGQLVGARGLAQGKTDSLHIVGVDGAHIGHADSMEHAFQVKLARRTMLQRFAIEGIALVGPS